MVRLLIVKGLNAGVTYEVGERTRIGRLGENEIQVSDPNVSRLHAEIVQDSGIYTIFDRGSKNGVLINGQEIAEKALAAGDEIVIGGSTFVFEPGYEIYNSRFSNNFLCLVDQPDAGSKSMDGLAKHPDSVKASHTLDAITDIFGGPPLPLTDTVNNICIGLQQLFKANGVAILLASDEDSPFQPLQIITKTQSLIVSSNLVRKALIDNTTVSIVSTVTAPPALGQSVDNSASAKKAQKTGDDSSSNATMASPMISGDNMRGVIVVQRQGETAFTASEMKTLQTVASLTFHTLESLRVTDHIRNISRMQAVLDAEQRSASTRSLRMQEIYNSAKRSADSPGTVLITGESGTGKETLAHFIHSSGSRAGHPFIVVNCAAIAADQFENEVYGMESVSPEGEVRISPGKVEEAHGGTLFLYEVGELELTLQPKLLRFIQDGAYYRQGGKRAIQANVRIIASATVDLAAAVRAGKFREDLWYRLNVVPFHMPPLRERREDIGPLVDFFINRHAGQISRKIIGANDGAISLLQKYDWPGNIRELNNAVERAVILSESKVLSTGDFAFIEEARRRLNSHADLERKRDTKPLAEVERQHIMIALKKHNFNQARAAEALGLHRNTLRNKIIEYGIEITK